MSANSSSFAAILLSFTHTHYLQYKNLFKFMYKLITFLRSISSLISFIISVSYRALGCSSMAAVKVYGSPISTCTCRVLICLHEKQLQFELLHVNLFNAEHKLPPFLAKNPFGQIPVLEDGDLTLFESRAITWYIANKYKETGPDLLLQQQSPKDKESAIVKLWMEVESHHYSPAITPIIHEFFTAHLQGHEPDRALIDRNLERLAAVLDVYEQRLGGTKYLAGHCYTLADLHHLPYTFYFMKTPWASLLNDRPNVKAWWDHISSRPAFLKVAQGMTFAAHHHNK